MSATTTADGFTAARECRHCRRWHFSRSKVNQERAERAAELSVERCLYRRVMKITMDLLRESYWQIDSIEVVAENISYTYGLVNPATGRRSPKHKRAGKLGKIVRLWDGRLAVMEYRVVEAGCDISPDAEFWRDLRASDEVTDFILAAREAGYSTVESVVYDVTRMPSLKPGIATPPELRKYTADGRLYANQREDDESPESYGRRIHEAVAFEPARYFRREEIVSIESDLLDRQRRLWATRNNVIL